MAATDGPMDRMVLFLAFDAKAAAASFSSHKGHKAVQQAAESAGNIPCIQTTAVLDDAIAAFENKC